MRTNRTRNISIVTRGDDAGVNHASNLALLQGVDAGWLKNISLMATGPSIEEAAALFAHRSDICFGLHFTMNAEWDGVKWQPISPKEEIASLLNAQQQFYPKPLHEQKILLDDIKREWQAQLAYLKQLGFVISYADTHMFPELVIDGLAEALHIWIKDAGLIDAGLIDAGYFYQPLLCMDDFAHHPGLATRILAHCKEGQYFCLHHPALDHPDMDACYNERNPKGSVRKKRAREAAFLQSEELQMIQNDPRVKLCRYDEAIQQETHIDSLREWRLHCDTNGYTVQVLDATTFQIDDAFGNHCYLLLGTTRCALIDTGVGIPSITTMVRSITDQAVLVLYTHGHFDHIGGFTETAISYLHPQDAKVAQLHASSVYRTSLITHALNKTDLHLSDSQITALQDIALPNFLPYPEDGILDLGERKLYILHTPGHTQGSVCILDSDYNRIYTGDTLVTKGVLLSFPESGNLNQFKQSLLRLQANTNSDTTLYGGHHETGISAEWIHRYIELIESIQKQEIQAEVWTSSLGKDLRYIDQDICIALPNKQE